MNVLPAREDCLRHAFYCEENVWHLCQHPRLEGVEKYVAVVSNTQQNVPHLGQRAADTADDVIVWDYHVYLLCRPQPNETWHIFDVDSRFGFPLPATEYLERTYAGEPHWPNVYRPLFKVMPATRYCAELRSDRSHMRTRDGAYVKPPPPWPTISAPATGSNLYQWTDMTDSQYGEIFDLPALRAWLALDSLSSH